MKKTIAQELGITEFPFDIKDERGNLIYLEFENQYWAKYKFDKEGKQIFYENSKGEIKDYRPKELPKAVAIEKTIAQQLGVTEFPFEIKDGKGNLIYEEYENGFWAREEFDREGTQIYHENSSGIIIDNRPKPTTPITLQHCLDRGFTVEKIKDEVYKEQHGKEYMLCYLKLSKRHMIDYCNATYRCMAYKVDREGTILERKYLKDVGDLDFYISFLGSEKVLKKLSKLG